jgi:hypothetical protein
LPTFIHVSARLGLLVTIYFLLQCSKRKLKIKGKEEVIFLSKDVVGSNDRIKSLLTFPGSLINVMLPLQESAHSQFSIPLNIIDKNKA